MAIIFSIISLIASYIIAGFQGLVTVFLLGILEISLSFDNAVVNAAVLKEMSEKWQKRFLNWGILIAVFGMRLIFPVLIVALAANLGFKDVVEMAIYNPDLYQENLEQSHNQIASFGAAFLGMVYCSFLLREKEVNWLFFEKSLENNNKFFSYVIFILFFLTTTDVNWLSFLIGISTYCSIKYFSKSLGSKSQYISAGLVSFVYLEILDASFSLDGVIGAFALSNNIIIIMLGLGIGAVFIRSMTLKLVQNKTLQQYKYLEHGAHYGIGSLAILMAISTSQAVPEIIIGLTGAFFIIWSLISSIRAK